MCRCLPIPKRISHRLLANPTNILTTTTTMTRIKRRRYTRTGLPRDGQTIVRCRRCKAMVSRTKRQCKNRTCVSHPYCMVHSDKLLGLRVKRASFLPGLGLYATRPFKKNKLKIRYEGDDIDGKEYDRRYTNKGKKGQYVLDVSTAADERKFGERHHNIDAVRTDSNMARYSNMCRSADHRKKKLCKGNHATFTPVSHELKNTNKGIKKDEEIFVDYGRSFEF